MLPDTLQKLNDLLGELQPQKELPAQVDFVKLGDEFGNLIPANKEQQPDFAFTPMENMQSTLPYKESIETWRQNASISPDGKYLATKVGPSGEELPYGALGWDWNGEPYYGDGLKGELNKLVSKLIAPIGNNEKPWIRQEDGKLIFDWRQVLGFLPEDKVEELQQQFQEEVKQSPKEEGVLEQFLGSPLKMTISAPEQAWKQIYSSEGGLLAVPLRAVGVLVEGVLDLVNEIGIKTEQMVSLGGQVVDVLANYEREGGIRGKYPVKPRLPTENVFLKEYQTGNGFDKERYFKENFNPITLDNVLGGKLLKPGSAAEHAWNSGRFLYSTIIAPELQGEYLRLLNAGWSPTLIASKLENPMAEMVGRVILDPLNLYDLPIFDAMRFVSKEIKVADEIEDFIKVGSLAGLPEGEALNLLTDVARVQLKSVARNRDKMLNLGRKLYGGEARYVIGQEMKAFFHATADTLLKDPDEFAIALEALLKLTSKNTDEVIEGLRLAKGLEHISPRILLSDTGTRTGILLREMLEIKGEENLVQALNHFMDGITGVAEEKGIVGVAEMLGKKAEKALDTVLPTFDDRLKLVEAIETGKIVPTDWQVKIAEISNSDRALYRFLQTNRELQKPFNAFFSMIYMGLSPAYAVRNAIQNVIITLKDYGLGALRFGAKDRLLKWTGGVIPDFAEKGIGAINAAERARFLEKIEFGSKLSQWAEAKSSLAITAHLYEQTMLRCLEEGRAIPLVDELIEAGIPQEVAIQLPDLIRRNYGDVRKAVGGLMAGDRLVFDPLEGLTFIPRDAEDVLRRFELFDEVAETIRQSIGERKLPEQIGEELNRYFDDLLREVAEDLRNEGVRLGVQSEFAQAIGIDALDGAIGEDVGKYMQVTNRYGAVDLAFQSIDNALMEKIYQNVDLIKTAAAQGGNVEELQRYIDVLKQLSSSIRTMKNETLRASNVWRDMTVRMRNTFMGEWAASAGNADEKAVVIERFANWITEQINRLDFSNKDELLEIVSVLRQRENSFSGLNSVFWEGVYFPYQDKLWFDTLNALKRAMKNLDVSKEVKQNIKVAETYLKLAERTRMSELRFYKYLAQGDWKNAVYALANSYGIESVGREGQILDRWLVEIIRNYSEREDLRNLQSLNDLVSAQYFDDLRNAFSRFVYDLYGKAKTKKAKELGENVLNALSEESPLRMMRELIPGFDGLTQPSKARMIWEGRAELRNAIRSIIEALNGAYGERIENVLPANALAKLEEWIKKAEKGIGEARYLAYQTARAGRDFTLLPYEKGLFDMVAGMVFPYQYWYSRSYINWMKRALNGNTWTWVSRYAKYKDMMAKIHAGAPDWWKYNVNSNELLGIDSDSPLFFNLEATLNPLYGITGVDFNDPKRKIDWLTATLDQANRFGPTLYTPITWLAALWAYKKGEVEAASRWASRLIPQTQTLKTALWKAGVKFYPYGLQAAPNEFDPLTQLWGGYDPYEKKRILRTLATLEQEGQITPTELVDASMYNIGKAWDLATQLHYENRFSSTMSSFLFGVGFKGRTVSDMQIDAFYNDLYRIRAMSGTLTTDEKRALYQRLYEQYPFGEALLLGSKNGIERNEAYIWNVLGRIAPGQSREIFESLKAYPLLQKFYDTKGDLSQMKPSEQSALMEAVINIGAVLQVPDSTTKQEWTQASQHYKEMRALGEQLFGENIWELLDEYNRLKRDVLDASSTQEAQAMLELYPQIMTARTWQAQMILADPVMGKYYAGISTIDLYYRGLKYEDLMTRFGRDIYQKNNIYYELKNNGMTEEAKKFLADNPQLSAFWSASKEWDRQIDEKVVLAAQYLPEGTGSILREDIDVENLPQQQKGIVQTILEQKEAQYYELPWQEYAKMFSKAQLEILVDAFEGGRSIPKFMYNRLETIANKLGVDLDRLLEILRIAYMRQQSEWIW